MELFLPGGYGSGSDTAAEEGMGGGGGVGTQGTYRMEG
jgi:hypothetical protein